MAHALSPRCNGASAGLTWRAEPRAPTQNAIYVPCKTFHNSILGSVRIARNGRAQSTTARSVAATTVETPVSDSNHAPDISATPTPSQTSQPFSWTEQWYPVGFLVDLPTDEPIPFSLFDTRLVLWHQGEGRWACMADECPHRRAPLSRGRLYRQPASAAAGSGAGAGATGAGGADDAAAVAGQGGDVVLECAYHGWQFDGSGECVRLPQLLPSGYVPEANTGSAGGGQAGLSSNSSSNGSSSGGGSGLGRRIPRSCSGRAYPTAVAQGMLWVWYGSGSRGPAGGCGGCGTARGGQQPPDESTIPLDYAEVGSRAGEEWALVDVFTRDFPYDWETMVENVVDPSHVAFAHDGTGQGLDRHASPPLELQVVKGGDEGFTGRFRGVRTLPAPPTLASSAPTTAAPSTTSSSPATSPSPSPSFAPGAWSVLEFRPPCLVAMRFTLPGKGDAGLVLYCVPLGRGRSRMIARLPRNFATGWLAGLQPRWAKHLPRMSVLDQDIDLLREQEAIMARAKLAAAASPAPEPSADDANGGNTDNGGGSNGGSNGGGGGGVVSNTGDWRRSYVMPAPADRFVVQFRRWMDRHGGSRPWALPEGAFPAAAAAMVGGSPAAAGSGGGDVLRREEVLDRYHSHVKSCSACRGALAAFTRLRDTCRVAALAAVAAAAGLAAAGAAVAAAAGAATTTATAASIGGWAAAAAALAAVLAGVSAWAAKMVQKFHYTEEGIELRLNEDRLLRRLLFSGTNSFNSMVALTNKKAAAKGGSKQ